MKFSIAAAAIAATSSFVGVHASKSGKGPCSSSPKLEKFCNEEPANFAGTYKTCYQNTLRNAADGFGPSLTDHYCRGDPIVFGGSPPDEWVLEKKDQFGAYVGARAVLYPSEGGTLDWLQ
jgi:hypothetical protein